MHIPKLMFHWGRHSVFSKKLSYRSGNRGYGTHIYRVTRRINTPKSILYHVIADVRNYENFVPLVIKSVVHESNSDTNYPSKAGFNVGWKQYEEEFSCQFDCQKDNIVAQTTGLLLFDTLHNEWAFKEVNSRFGTGPCTLLDVVLEYKFHNPLYNTLSSMLQDHVSNIIIRAFENQALRLYKQEKENYRVGAGTE